MNYTNVVGVLQSEAVQDKSVDIVKYVLDTFLSNPMLWGGVTIGFVLLVVVILKQWIDWGETGTQNWVWSGMLYALTFIVGLVFLILFDAGEVTFLNGLFAIFVEIKNDTELGKNILKKLDEMNLI